MLSKRPQKRKFKARSNVICIRIFANIEEAEIAKNCLIANGIVADVFKEGYSSANPLIGFAAGARLMIKEEDKETALNLLENLANKASN